MNIHFDKDKLRFAIKFTALASLIFIVGIGASRELAEFIGGDELLRYDFLPAKSFAPVYEALADGAVIYSNGDGVLERSRELMREESDFILADLDEKTIALYKKGVARATFKIMAKGKDGSFFETPNGEYRIKSKESNHFSTIGKVWMPWSMHFFGNYFIHGWPYYPDGTDVADSFSGGCIRLSTADAKELFGMANPGMPVLVRSSRENRNASMAYFKKVVPGAPASIPNVSASAALVTDFESGQVIFEKSKNEQYPIASLTKLMTALAALESIGRFNVLTMTKEALDTPGDSGGILEGEEFESEDYLYPLILSSSNDVARLYQNQVWGFMNIMNEKAKAIGLGRTAFADASGISSKNISTAEDIFKLLRYINDHKKPLFELSGLREYTLSSTNGMKKHTWVNINWSVDDARFIGGKSGKTEEALETMAGVYKLKLSESDERPIFIAVLHSQDRVRDVSTIIDHIKDNFVYGTAIDRGETTSTAVKNGASLYEALLAPSQ